MDRRTASSKKPQQAVGPCRSQTPSTGGTLSLYSMLNSGTATISPEARSAQSRSRQDIGSVFGLSRSGVMSMVGGA